MNMPSPNCSTAGSQSGLLSERRAADGETYVFEVVASQRRRLEAGEAVEAGDLAEAMHGDDRADAGKLRIAIGVPDGARQSLGMKMRVGAVDADQGLPARQQLILGDPRVFGLVGLRAGRSRSRECEREFPRRNSPEGSLSPRC